MKINIIGKKFNKLTVLQETNHRSKDGSIYYLCRCDCGKTKTATATGLKGDHVQSCGDYLCKTKYIDWIGKKIGYLTVIKITKDKYNYYFECSCDCGNISRVNIDNFITKKTKSCGCKRTYLLHKKRGNQVDNVEKACYLQIFNTYEKNAKKRGLEFLIDFNIFVDLIKKECYYCGVDKFNEFTYNGKKTVKYNGIDRINNTLGYTEKNCRTACGICNRAKHKMPVKLFEEWIERIRNKK